MVRDQMGPMRGKRGRHRRARHIKRSDGNTQVTHNGHPLYTYVGDTAPGQAFGNNLGI